MVCDRLLAGVTRRQISTSGQCRDAHGSSAMLHPGIGSGSEIPAVKTRESVAGTLKVTLYGFSNPVESPRTLENSPKYETAVLSTWGSFWKRA